MPEVKLRVADLVLDHDNPRITRLPASEVAKGLRRIVYDLATKARQVGSLMRKEQIVDYVSGLGSSLPDLSRARGTERSLDEIPISEFPKSARPTRREPDPSQRKEVVPRSCVLNVTDSDAIAFLKRGLSKWPKKTLIYLDPPYYDQGRELYYDYYQPQDHADVAEVVEKKMAKQFWMVSYDNVSAIRKLYSGFRSITYDVGYTAREMRTGREVMFFSPKLNIPSLVGPVQQVGRLREAA